MGPSLRSSVIPCLFLAQCHGSRALFAARNTHSGVSCLPVLVVCVARSPVGSRALLLVIISDYYYYSKDYPNISCSSKR